MIKKTARAKVVTALAISATLIAGAGAAHADDISNRLDSTVDALAEVMPLNVGGPDGSTELYVINRNGDGKNGCNLTGGTELKLDLASSDEGVATVSPSTVTFTSCGDTKSVTVSPVAAGESVITASEASNTTGGAFNLVPVTFRAVVAGPSNTAPSLTVAGVDGGASYALGEVPAATCEVSDAEDGPSSFPATLSTVSGPYAGDGIGNQTASCSHTDAGGLTASASETYSIVDPSAPEISHVLTPSTPDGSNGWYRSDVTLTWTVHELQSPSSLSVTDCVDQSIADDQQETAYSCAASSAGGDAAEQSVRIKRDATAPEVGYTGATGTVGSNGWYTSPVTATFTAEDATSGPATATQTATSIGEGTAVTVESPAFTDNAGNASAAGAVSRDFKIDLTNPTATFDSSLSGPIYFGSVPAAPTCTAQDDVSGPAACEITGYSTDVGTHTLTATARDNAGRTGIATQTYTVLSWTASGFYKPVNMDKLNTVKGGSTVPVKFELFAGGRELTDTSYVALSAKPISCNGSDGTDPIELTSAGNTSLRYDTTEGQFIYNWKTPSKAGSCYRLTMTADDGSWLSADFQLK